MTTLQILITVYLVMLIITIAIVYSRLGGDRRYRFIVSLVLGIVWIIPVALFLIISVEGLIFDLINWLERRKL